MRKTLLLSALLLAVAFIAISLLRQQPQDAAPRDGAPEVFNREKQDVQKFWSEYRLATRYRIDGETAKAAAKYQSALALNPGHEDAFYYLGNMNYELKKYVEARDAWQRLLQINPASTRACVQLGNLYHDPQAAQLADIQLADSLFRRAHEINGEESGPLLGLGRIALLKDDFPRAEQYFAAVLGSNFRSVEAYLLSGYIAWKNGDDSRALAQFENAVKHSRPLQPVAGVAGEGDTKSATLSPPKFSSQLFVEAAEGLAVIEGTQLSKEMSVRYKYIDARITELRKILLLSGQPRGDAPTDFINY